MLCSVFSIFFRASIETTLSYRDLVSLLFPLMQKREFNVDTTALPTNRHGLRANCVPTASQNHFRNPEQGITKLNSTNMRLRMGLPPLASCDSSIVLQVVQ